MKPLTIAHRNLFKQMGVKAGQKISIGDLMRKSKEKFEGNK